MEPNTDLANELAVHTMENDVSATYMNPFTFLLWLVWILLTRISYTLIYLLRGILSATFQITFSVHSIIYLLLILAPPLYGYIRYSYLESYSKLPKDSKRQNPTIDTFIDSNDDNEKNHTKSYLDKFLSAIKIFGYLDNAVFHELTKSLQTQKLDSGEIIILDECKGFSICVEGEIQVYSKIADLSSRINDQINPLFVRDDNYNVVIVDGVKYQLLNIIKSGNPLSSFITILELLTSTQNTLTSMNPTPNLNQTRHLPHLPRDNFTLDRSVSDDVLSSSTPPKNSPELIAIPKSSCTISMIPKESFTRIATKYPKDTSHIVQMILTKLYRVTFQTAHNFLDLTPNIFQTEINVNQNFDKIDQKLPNYLRDLAINYIEEQEHSNVDSSAHSIRSKKRSYGYRVKSKHMRHPSMTTRHSKNFDKSSHSPSSPIHSRLDRTNCNNESSLSVRMTNSTSTPLDSFDTLLRDDHGHTISADYQPTFEHSNGSATSSVGTNNSSKLNKAHKSRSRHFTLDHRNTANPGDLLSNVPLPRNSDVNLRMKSNISQLELDELKDRTFSADDEETGQSTLRTALAERVSSIIGLNKHNFPIEPSQKENSNSRLNMLSFSPLISASDISSSIRHVKESDREASRHSKIRTFSTTSMDAFDTEEADNSSASSDPYKSLATYESIKREFSEEIRLFKVSKGTKLIKSNEQTLGIYFVINGSFDVTYWRNEIDLITNYIDDPKAKNLGEDSLIEEYLYTVNEGDIAGYLGTLIGSKSFVDVTAKRDSYVAFLSREFFDLLTEKYPQLQLSIARLLLNVLDRKLYLIDYAMEWIHTYAGDILYRQSDPANGIYLVLNGRFRSLTRTSENGQYVILGEHGQGESMGEIEVLTKSKRLNTVVSIRDSELARIPRTLFEIIALTNPSIMVSISRIVANRVKNNGLLLENNANMVATASTHIKDEPMVQSFNNYKTLTLLPVSQDSIPLSEFAEKLGHALEKIGKDVIILNQTAALSNLGKHAFDKLAKLKQGGFFSELEEKYDFVIYVCDSGVNSNWTSTCIQQGDCILLLADSMQSPDVGEYERLLVKSKTTARTELVLLHPERYIEPGSTNKWLKNRIWVHAHHHIQLQCHIDHSTGPDAKTLINQIDSLTTLRSTISRKLTNNIKSKVENAVANNEFWQFLKQTKEEFRSKRYYQPLQEHKDDFLRLARILTGQAIGLVLGGGGARGISHVGVIKALEDHGIPVDVIGGTSIGAFVGGLYAKDYDFVPVYGRVKTFAGRMSSLWRSLFDLTIPLTSYLTGHDFNRGIWKAFGDARIEDFWIKYYANSTNLTDSVMEVHTNGYAWKYIRASMTLASLLPPITDDGNMLLDGGYIDNLTVTEMQRRGVKHIIAVDVGSVDDRSRMEYGNSLNGWWVLINRLNPFSSHANVPTMADIQMRLAYVASVNALERAKNSKGCSYLRPPIENYATLAFGKFPEIYNVGLDYGNSMAGSVMKELNINSKRKEFIPNRKNRRRYSM